MGHNILPCDASSGGFFLIPSAKLLDIPDKTGIAVFVLIVVLHYNFGQPIICSSQNLLFL